MFHFVQHYVRLAARIRFVELCTALVFRFVHTSVQDMVRAWPVWMQVNLARVVSHHPLRDVSIITWFAFLLGCHRFGENKSTERDKSSPPLYGLLAWHSVLVRDTYPNRIATGVPLPTCCEEAGFTYKIPRMPLVKFVVYRLVVRFNPPSLSLFATTRVPLLLGMLHQPRRCCLPSPSTIGAPPVHV